MSVQLQTSTRLRTAAIVVGLVGVWGALIPFVGPSFGYGMGSSQAWQWSETLLTLHLAPGVVAAIGAAMMMRAQRGGQLTGAVLGVLGGVWFVIAPSLHPLWADQGMGGSMSMGESALSGALSALGYHYGTGVLIAVAAAYAWGALGSRASSTPSGYGDMADADQTQPQQDAKRPRATSRA